MLLLTAQTLYSQVGYIRGKVFDAETGETMPGVTIFAEGTQTGVITDLDGEFSLSIAPGTYDIRISFVSYETVILSGTGVSSGKVTQIEDVGLITKNIGIEEVIITGQTIRNTEAALISMKRKSPNVLDGISGAELKSTGDSDVASSMRRISGVSVSDGKYVFVRGLGDRYTKTILNGVDVPGLDPDRNTLQMDLFPTSIIDNILVHKSFSADLPADFTGGVINIEIKDFPARKKAALSVNMGYNPGFHFNPEYLAYKGSPTDFLGFDNGTRAIPATSDIPQFAEIIGNPGGIKGQRYAEILNSFNPAMNAFHKRSFMDFGLGGTYGNQVTRGKWTIGTNFALTYKNETEFYRHAEDARYGLVAIPTVYEMEVREHQLGSYGVNKVYLTGLAGVAVKTNYSRLRLYLLHLQNGESKAGIFDFEGSDQGSEFSSIQHTLDYSQRSLTNLLVDGKHRLLNTDWEIEWKVSPSLSLIQDPDVRFTRYEVTGNGSFRIGTEVGFPERIWRNLQEINIASVGKVTKSFDFLSRRSKLHFGGAYTFKYRDFAIRKFLLNVRGGDNGQIPLTGNPAELLSEEMKWPLNGDYFYGTTFEHDFHSSNRYHAHVDYAAAFFSTELALMQNLTATGGLRIEKYDQYYTGQNQTGSKILDNAKVLADLDFFPYANLVYKLKDDMNLRFSFAKTIARPSLKELSYAEIYDPISGRTFIGGLHNDTDPVEGIIYWDGNLESTGIYNYDVRWEWFGSSGQLISLGGFYKKFINPIEMVQFATQIGAFQPRNVGDGEVYGSEFETRQNFGLFSERLSNFGFSSNITLTESRIELSVTEYESRTEHAREDQEIGFYREMAGQSPFIVNAGIFYSGGDSGFWKKFEAGLYYNVQGTTLQYVGIVDRPDIYALPFHSLNFNSNFVVGPKKNMNIGIKVENLLGATRQMVYKSCRAAEQTFEFRDPGRNFSLSLEYLF